MPHEARSRAGELIQWLLLALMFASAAYAWPRVPDTIPMHWNAAGEVDNYGAKLPGLLLVPLLSLGMYALFRVLPRLDPGRANYARFGPAYTSLRVGILAFMAFLQLAVVAAALGYAVPMGSLMPLAFGFLFIGLGALLPRFEPNWFVGIRTPWTLSSALAWRKTHALGRWVFVATGLGTIVAGWVNPEWGFWALMVGGLGGAALLVAYSYLVWRDAPDKVTPGGPVPGA